MKGIALVYSTLNPDVTTVETDDAIAQRQSNPQAFKVATLGTVTLLEPIKDAGVTPQAAGRFSYVPLRVDIRASHIL